MSLNVHKIWHPHKFLEESLLKPQLSLWTIMAEQSFHEGIQTYFLYWLYDNIYPVCTVKICLKILRPWTPRVQILHCLGYAVKTIVMLPQYKEGVG